MIDQCPIFEIPRLAPEGLSVRKIAKRLGLSRQTTSKYLDHLDHLGIFILCV